MQHGRDADMTGYRCKVCEIEIEVEEPPDFPLQPFGTQEILEMIPGSSTAITL